MASFNQITIVGNVGGEPRIVKFASGGKVAEMSIATTRRGYTTQGGAIIPDRTEWHRVKVNGSAADFAEQFIKTGSSVFVQGELRYRDFKDAQGIDRTTAEIIAERIMLLDRRQQATAAPAEGSGDQAQAPAAAVSAPAGAEAGKEDGDDLPF